MTVVEATRELQRIKEDPLQYERKKIQKLMQCQIQELGEKQPEDNLKDIMFRLPTLSEELKDEMLQKGWHWWMSPCQEGIDILCSMPRQQL